jgi:hypothetical protein
MYGLLIVSHLAVSLTFQDQAGEVLLRCRDLVNLLAQ